MRKSLQLNLPPSPLEDLQRPAEVSAEDVQREVQWRQMVADAAQKSGYSRKALASDLGISESQLSGQLSGLPSQHLSWFRMRGLSREFWQELVTLVIQFHGLDVGADPETQRYAEIGRRVCEVLALSEGVRRRA